MKKHAVNLFVPTLILVWALAYWLDILDVSAHDKLLITPVSILIFVLYCYFAFVEFSSYRKERAIALQTEGETTGEYENTFWIKLPRREIAIIFMLAIYLLVVQYLGFGATSFLFMFGMLYLLGVRRLGIMFGFSIISTAVLYFAFKVVLMVPLPGGILGF